MPRYKKKITTNDIVFLTALVILVQYAFSQLSVMWANNDLSYYTFSPNAYRLWTQFIVVLTRYGLLSLAAITSIQFLLSVIVLWILIRKTDELPAILLGLVVVCLFLRIMDAPMYIILALLGRTKRSELLIPLVLLKEIAFWLGFGYLLLFCRSKRTFILGCISATLYIIIRFALIGNRPLIYPDAPVILLPMIVSEILTMSLVSFLFYSGIAIALILTVVRDWTQVMLAIWLFIPVLVFSVFWEPQHWLMLVILLVAHRLEQKKEFL